MKGGKRTGAGAPKKDPKIVKIPVGLRLQRWIVEWMRKQPESAAFLIESALIQKHELRPPHNEKDESR